MEQMKTCFRCKENYPVDMYRKDPSKRDGRYPSCRICTSPGGWASFMRIVRRVPCPGCGGYFTPRHNMGKLVRHCSRACATEHGAWRGSNNGTWQGNDIGYAAAHQRVAVRRGKASSHGCVDCGDRAAQWSVNRDAARLRFEDGMPYSTESSDYEARCVSCHKLYDLDAVAA